MKNIIVAVDDKWGIGKDGKLPWHISEDLTRFKRITKNNICIMGYNTFHEIAIKFDYENTKKFLPNRISYIITSKPITEVVRKELTVKKFTSINNALKQAELDHPDKEIFFLGGYGIFKEALDYADKILFTKVNGDWKCDTFFPYEKYQSLFNDENLVIDKKTENPYYTFCEIERD